MVDDSYARKVPNKSTVTPLSSQFNQVQIQIKTSQWHENQDLPTSYWRTNFMLSCLPLIAWGIPSYLIFRKGRIQSTKEWLQLL